LSNYPLANLILCTDLCDLLVSVGGLVHLCLVFVIPGKEGRQMSRSRRRLRPKSVVLSDMCAEWGEEDGIDSREWGREKRTGDERKVRQLCGQVSKVLGCVLAECGDPLLFDLMIEDVSPAPDARRLRVSVRPIWSTPEQERDLSLVLDRLNAQKVRFREEMGRAIRRRRLPDLWFLVMPPATTHTLPQLDESATKQQEDDND
jgi:ribosome-binding factor A